MSSIHASTVYNRLQETGAEELSPWLNFFFPILEQFCLHFIQIAQKGLILTRQVSFCPDGSHFAHNTTPNPCSLLSSHTPLSWICTYTKHPKTHPKTLVFLAWTWKWAKWTTIWATWTQLANFLKSGQNFSRSGQKKIIHDKFNCNRLHLLQDTIFNRLQAADPKLIMPNFSLSLYVSKCHQGKDRRAAVASAHPSSSSMLSACSRCCWGRAPLLRDPGSVPTIPWGKPQNSSLATICQRLCLEPLLG